MHQTFSASQLQNNPPRRQLVEQLMACPPNEAAARLEVVEPTLAFQALADLNPAFTQSILRELPDNQRQAIIHSATPELARQWQRNRAFDKDTIGYFMEPAYATFLPEMTVEQAIEKLCALVKVAFITYGYVTGPDDKLLGLVTMRDLGRFAGRHERRADRHRVCCGNVLYCQFATFPARIGTGAGGFFGDGRGMHDQRHFRCACSADAETLGYRPCHRIQHFSDHSH